MSLFFILVIVIPFIGFIIWLLRQDKRKNYLGIVVLMAAIIAAVLVAFWVDAKFMQP